VNPSAELLERTAELKGQLLELAHSLRFRAEVDEQLMATLESRGACDESELAFALDAILLDHHFSSGKTLVDHFLDLNLRLPADERAMLLSWRHARQGVFRIDAKDDGALVMYNLVDDLTYRAYANAGPAFTDQVEIGWYLLARLVPLGEDWLFSGGQLPIMANEVDVAYRTAIEMTRATPTVVFQNPKLLELGWDLQRKERADFVQYFGSDFVTVRPDELKRRMDDYMRWRMNSKSDETGKTMIERSLESHGRKPDIPSFEIPDGLEDSESIGIIYDEVDGLHILPDFGLIAEVFADPSLLEDPRHEETLRWYLESQDIVPLPLRLLSDRDPSRATEIFQNLLDAPEFDWVRDGEALLRDYKDWYFREPVMPGVSPIPDGLADYERRPSTSKHVGRNNPCPCGSGRKFKHCHGRSTR